MYTHAHKLLCMCSHAHAKKRTTRYTYIIMENKLGTEGKGGNLSTCFLLSASRSTEMEESSLALFRPRFLLPRLLYQDGLYPSPHKPGDILPHCLVRYLFTATSKSSGRLQDLSHQNWGKEEVAREFWERSQRRNGS